MHKANLVNKEGSGAETNPEARGVNIWHLQWDIVCLATAVKKNSVGTGVYDLHFAASSLQWQLCCKIPS